MLKCLQCGTPLEQDFGITACLNCGAVMMIDMDGQVQLAEDKPVSEEPAVSFEGSSSDFQNLPENSDFSAEGDIPGSFQPVTDFEAVSGVESPGAVFLNFSNSESGAPAPEEKLGVALGSSLDAAPVDWGAPAEENPAPDLAEPFMADPFANAEGIQDAVETSEPVPMNFSESVAEDSAEGVSEGLSESDEVFTDFSASADSLAPAETFLPADSAAGDPPVMADDNWFDRDLSAQPEAAPAAVGLATADFSDVSDFANQTSDLGALQFEVAISGIDHADLRADVLEVLGEPRLGFAVRELSPKIQDGVLVLGGLNAARASVVVSRLQHLDVRLQWRQKVYET